MVTKKKGKKRNGRPGYVLHIVAVFLIFLTPARGQWIERDARWTPEREIGFTFGTPKEEILSRVRTDREEPQPLADSAGSPVGGSDRLMNAPYRLHMYFDTAFFVKKLQDTAYRFWFIDRFLGGGRGTITYYFERGYLSGVRFWYPEDELPEGFAGLLLKFLADRSLELLRPASDDPREGWGFLFRDDIIGYFWRDPERRCFRLHFLKAEPEEETDEDGVEGIS